MLLSFLQERQEWKDECRIKSNVVALFSKAQVVEKDPSGGNLQAPSACIYGHPSTFVYELTDLQVSASPLEVENRLWSILTVCVNPKERASSIPVHLLRTAIMYKKMYVLWLSLFLIHPEIEKDHRTRENAALLADVGLRL